MGMDVYGKNPKQNVDRSMFSTLHEYESMEFRERWKLLDKDEELRQTYWLEKDDYETVNVGHYFRNNCWWWRPLWNYCYAIADDIISEDVFESGHSNSGAGLNAEDSAVLGQRLLIEINNGNTIQYQAEYQQYLDDLSDSVCTYCKASNKRLNKMKDCKPCNGTGKLTNFNKHYPFDIDNVKEFAEFCIQSGGFEIN